MMTELRKVLPELDICLPRKDEDGNYYISYSQYSSFKSDKSFNLGIAGKYEYMLGYFMGISWPDQGWSTFGSEVEDYICYRKFAEKFSHEEQATMEQIVPLGNFQIKVKLWLAANLYILGYIDDATFDLSTLVDYKTASKTSKERYYKDDYEQLDIYSLFVLQETGKLPDKLEVRIIQRLGNCFGKVERRDLLSVGTDIWYHERTTSEERLLDIKSSILKTVHEISDLYKVFLKTNN